MTKALFTTCSVVVAASLFTVRMDLHYHEALWMIVISLSSFFCLNRWWGITFLIFNALIYSVFFLVFFDKSEFKQVLSSAPIHIELAVELSVAMLLIAYVMLQYERLNREALANAFQSVDLLNQEKQIVEAQNKENSVLLQEIHHRVKNNLQVVTSLLNLQSSYTKDNDTKAVLEESIQRIRSMSMIHETLYQSKKFASINFSTYLTLLTNDLMVLYNSRVDLSLKIVEEISPLRMNIQQAIPCGLIVNELITNSLKHAFIEKSSGEIYLRLEEKNGAALLHIGDNGKGLPKDFDWITAESLGLQLVQTLVEQLEGTLEVSSVNGTYFDIQFPLMTTV